MNSATFEPLPPIKKSDMPKSKKGCKSGFISEEVYENVIYEPLKSPFWIYIITIMLGIGGAIFWVGTLPTEDEDGIEIMYTQRWVPAIISIFLGFLIAFFILLWIVEESKNQRYWYSWIIFFIGIISAFSTFLITFILFSALVGITRPALT